MCHDDQHDLGWKYFKACLSSHVLCAAFEGLLILDPANPLSVGRDAREGDGHANLLILCFGELACF